MRHIPRAQCHMWLVAATLDIAGLGSEKGTFEEQISPLEARECSMEFRHVAGCLELQKYLLVKMWVENQSSLESQFRKGP